MVSRMMALKSASLLSKYRYTVPLVTPALRATSSSFVAAKPRSTNTWRAAATISAGAAAFRRGPRGLAAALGGNGGAPHEPGELLSDGAGTHTGSPPGQPTLKYLPHQ